MTAKERYWKAYYAANREKIRERIRRYEEDNREKMDALRRDYRARTRDKTRKRNQAYYLNNREEKLENNKRRVRIEGIYLGMVGMTHKQRQKFIKEVNGQTQ